MNAAPKYPLLPGFCLLVFFLPAAFFGSPGVAAEIAGLQGLDETRDHFIDSDETGRGYHVFVGLPTGYAETADRRYPTVYILDGGELYPMLRAYYNYLRFGEEIPDLILVAISYGTGDWRNGNDRSHDFTAPADDRDFWGGAADFQRFVGEELIPFVESEYRTRSDRRIVFGQSLGGQFVLHAAQTDPALFWGYIASNPALHRNLPFFLEPRDNWRGNGDKSKLFVGSGSLDDERFREPALQWMSHWRSVEHPPWELETVTLDGHSHFSAPPAAFRQGLVWLFSTNIRRGLQ